MFTIFLKGKNQQVITFEDENRSKVSRNSHTNQGSFRQPRMQVLDLGSCKETVTLFESNDTQRDKLGSFVN